MWGLVGARTDQGARLFALALALLHHHLQALLVWLEVVAQLRAGRARSHQLAAELLAARLRLALSHRPLLGLVLRQRQLSRNETKAILIQIRIRIAFVLVAVAQLALAEDEAEKRTVAQCETQARCEELGRQLEDSRSACTQLRDDLESHAAVPADGGAGGRARAQRDAPPVRGSRCALLDSASPSHTRLFCNHTDTLVASPTAARVRATGCWSAMICEYIRSSVHTATLQL